MSPNDANECVARAQRLASVGQLVGGFAHEIVTPVQYASDSLRFVEATLVALRPALQAMVTEQHGPTTSHSTGGPWHGDGNLLPANLATVIDEIPECLAAALEGIQRIEAAVRVMQSLAVCGEALEAAVDVNCVLDTAIDASRAEWKYEATIVRDFDESLPAVVCLAGEVMQAFVNVLMNAGQAIADARRLFGISAPLGTITVTTRARANDVHVRIADTGVGMSAIVMQRALEPFFTTKATPRATGLGLAFAEYVMRRHHGRLTLESMPGIGSVISLSLPLLSDTADLEG